MELATSHGRTRGVSFLTALDETWVEGRTDRIARAVGNLLDNALKWSPDGGTVEVLCRAGDIAVRDHGPGIDPEDLPHIFDRFYRARAARALPGSGLGLAIVAQVASEEGGSVRAAQRRRTAAPSCTLHLPVAAPAGQSVARPAARPGQKRGLTGRLGTRRAWTHDPRTVGPLTAAPGAARAARCGRGHRRPVGGARGHQPTTVGLVGDSLSAESVPAIAAYLGPYNDKVDAMALAGSGHPRHRGRLARRHAAPARRRGRPEHRRRRVHRRLRLRRRAARASPPAARPSSPPGRRPPSRWRTS